MRRGSIFSRKSRMHLLFLSFLSVLFFLLPGKALASKGDTPGLEEEAGETFSYEEVQELAEEPDTSLIEELDFSEVQDTIDEILGGEFRFENTVLDLITGRQPFTLESFLEAAVRQVKEG